MLLLYGPDCKYILSKLLATILSFDCCHSLPTQLTGLGAVARASCCHRDLPRIENTGLLDNVPSTPLTNNLTTSSDTCTTKVTANALDIIDSMTITQIYCCLIDHTY